jgi:LAO/AO transport system kinase
MQGRACRGAYNDASVFRLAHLVSDRQGILRGERLALSRAITLVESSRESHRLEAERLLDYVVRERAQAGASHMKPRRQLAVRIGVAGPPGAGKSTFIEAIGRYLIEVRQLVSRPAHEPSISSAVGNRAICGSAWLW